MERLWQDLRGAFRQLRLNPGFAAGAIAPLALAIAFTTAVLSLTDAVLFRPTGIKNPDRIAAVYGFSRSQNRYLSLSYPDFQDIQSLHGLIESAGAYVRGAFAVQLNGAPELMNTELVTGGYFRATGAVPVIGRPLTEDDDSTGAEPVALISYALWQNRFGRSTSVLGTSIKIKNTEFTIVGVMPRDYRGMLLDWYGNSAFWLPLAAFRRLIPTIDDYEHRREDQLLMMAARLRPGVSVQQLQAALDVLATRVSAKPDLRFTALPSSQARFFPAYRAQTVRLLVALIGACGIALAIACFNLASLLLARAASRKREIATRLALGASRLRLMQQFLAENLAIAASAGVISIPLSLALLPFLREAPVAYGFSLALNLTPDARALEAGILAGLATALLLSIAPALKAARGDVARELRGRIALRDLLGVAQAACAMAALAAAALLAKSLQDQSRTHLGFDPAHVLIATVGNGAANATLLAEVRAQAPEAALASNALPTTLRATFDIRPDAALESPPWKPILGNWVSDGYFELLRMPIASGRGFLVSDTASSPPVAVVNRTAAAQLWPGENPVGRRFRLRGQTADREVVGVVEDARYRPLGAEEGAIPYIFLPAFQNSGPRDYTLHVRVPGDPLQFLPKLREIMARFAPDAPLYEVRTLEDQVGLGLGPMRMAAGQIGAVSFLGLGLAIIGIFASSAYRVAQRKKEIAIRIALGATAAGAIRLFTARGLATGVAGAILGLAPALWGERLLRASIQGTSAAAPSILAAGGAVLVCAAALAAWAAASRITRIEPATVLRDQ